MMRKIFILLLITSCLLPGVVTAGDYPVLDNQVETRRAHLKWILTLQKISMEAVVEYIDEISGGEGVSGLESLLSEFAGQIDDIDSYTTHVGLNNFLRGLKSTTGSFRIESREQMQNYDGKALVLMVRIGETLAENQGQIDDLKDHYWDIRKGNVIENFDIRVERAQSVLGLLEERGYDVSEAQAKLADINELRDGLEAAIIARDNLEIISVSVDSLELSRELAEIVRALQVEIPLSRALRHWVNVCSRVVDRSGLIIEELKNLGLDTESLEAIYGEAESNLALVETSLESGDFATAITALQEFTENLIELCDAYVDLVFPEGVPDAFKEALTTMVARLEGIAENLEENLQIL